MGGLVGFLFQFVASTVHGVHRDGEEEEEKVEEEVGYAVILVHENNCFHS